MMMIILRRLRGSIATVLAWGVVWSILGTGYFYATIAWPGLRGRRVSCVSDNLLDIGPFWGVWGAIGAVVFSLALMVGERGRAIGSLSTIRVAGWGALGGMTLPLVVLGFALAYSDYMILTDLYPLVVGAALGAGCAAGALAIARRGEQSVGR